jgi:RHS repeat-associated protein
LRHYSSGLVAPTLYLMICITYYEGNRIIGVNDYAIHTCSFQDNGHFFRNDPEHTTEYFYDNNGNLTRDLNKGITNITYNHLNLPYKIEFENNRRIYYIYDANGTKLRKYFYEDNHLMSTTDYSGMFIYSDDHLDNILTSEGRLKFDNHDSLFYAEYFIKDHLGNVRTVLTTDPNFNWLAQQTDYYPFGLEIAVSGTSDNQIKYNSKELQTDAKLGWYDYGARFYDPVLGRWHSVDPMAETSRRWSPYNYCMDNPIRFIDPDGMNVDNFYYNQNGELVKREKNSNPDRFYVQTGETQTKTEARESCTIEGETVTEYVRTETPIYEEVTMGSDVGSMARSVYAEMGGEDQNSKQIVAESIKNRTELPENTYEHADSYKEAIGAAYDVSKPDNAAHLRYTNPELSTTNNPGDRESFANSVGVAIKVDNSAKSERIGQGVIFYNSASSTIYDNNKKMQKINLNVTTSGIKGAWKLKDY